MKNPIKKIKETNLKKKELREKIIDYSFCNFIGPQSGINFAHEKFVSVGDGWEACIYIYKFPKEVDMHWLNIIGNIEDTIVSLDIGSINTTEIQKNLQRSMEEQDSRYRTAKNNAERINAESQYQEFEEMYREVSQMDTVMKTVVARIFVAERTMHELDERVSDILANLDGTGFKAGICINETKNDWKNIIVPYKEQQKNIYRRKGQPILSSTLALGNPFHFTSLSDPAGIYYGLTPTGGNIFLDIFNATSTRLSYNGIVAGKMGSGKSTLLKKIIIDRTMRGDKTRFFDVSGEFKTVAESLGGRVIYLDGKGKSIINALQILSSSADEEQCFSTHMAKLTTIYKYLKPSAEENELLILEKLLRLFYIKWGILDNESHLTKPLALFQNTDFPIWGDFLTFLKEGLDESDEERTEDTLTGTFGDIREAKTEYVENIELLVEKLVQTNGSIFNGHTSLTDFYKEQVVCFNVANLDSAGEAVFNAQLFLALSLCWENCVADGKEENEKYTKGSDSTDDIRNFLIIIDEAHRFINAQKLEAVKQIILMEREARKYFGGLYLASQSIRDFVPEGSDSEGINLIKTLFELTTYKWILNQDNNAKSMLSSIFDGVFTLSQLEQVPRLEKGNTMLAIADDEVLNFSISIAWDEEPLCFAGGGK